MLKYKIYIYIIYDNLLSFYFINNIYIDWLPN